MANKYVCDGCGKEGPGIPVLAGYAKPRDWFQRGDNDGNQDACSRECIQKIASKSGKTSVVLPL